MAASNGYRPLSRKELEEDEWRIDNERGRRYCRTHPEQQMMPILPHLDVCPACSPWAQGHDEQPANVPPTHAE